MKVKKQVDEITIFSGKLQRDIEESLFDLLDSKIKKKKILESLVDFAQNEYFIDLKNVDGSDLYKFWSDGGRNLVFKIKDKKYKKLESRFFWTAFMYRLVKENFKMKKFEDIKFIEVSDNYYFFDPELKDYVGMVSCSKWGDTSFYNNSIKKSALCVNVSAIDPVFIGRGYGKKMYLAIIEDAGCLLSDMSLYESSLNIWVNILPKHVRYVGYLDEFGNLVSLKGRVDTKADTIRRFFATNDQSFLLKPIKK